MNNNCIGVFDSGLGGLTAVKELIKILPGENIIYFGDTGRVPYGTRSKETIIKYVRQNINFLLKFNVKAILAACGTASTLAIDEIKDEYNLPVIGVVDSTVMAAKNATKNKKIGIIGTPGTINSGVYEKKIKALDNSIETTSSICTLFVPVVESGRYKKDDSIVKILVEEYLYEIKQKGVDTLILGCTHYPLLKDAIKSYLGDGVTLIDSGECASAFLKNYLINTNQLSDEENSKVDFFVSDNVYNFANIAAQFLQKEITHQIKKIDIEKY